MEGGKSIDMFQSMFNESPLGMLVLGKSGKVLRSNKAAGRMLSADGKILPDRFTDYFDPDSRKNLQQAFTSLNKDPSSPISLEMRYTKDPDGGDTFDYWCRLNVTGIRVQEKGGFALYGILEDISGQKGNETRLRDEKEASERATRTKSDFLANMSHEIRTPIHTIIGMCELLQETKLDDEQAEYAGQVQFSADVLLSLVNDILDFSKIEAGKMKIETIEFDLYETIEKAVDLVALEAHKKGLEVVVSIGHEVPLLLEGDPVRLRQIVVNLFNNAMKFTKEGEIMVSVEVERKAEKDVVLLFRVRDTGIGIPKEKMDRLFRGFSQVDSSTTRKFGGTGLGLSISKNLVEMMGGTIGVVSEFGKGSTFWFTVKMGIRKGKGMEFSVPEDALDTSILVVDDNKSSRLALHRYFNEWGCKADEVESGALAIEKMREKAGAGEPYSCCFIDLLMPGMDGWQLASEINSDKNINSTRLVLMSPTGKSGEEAKMKLLKWFDIYLSKPVRKREVFDAFLKIAHSEMDLEAVDELLPVEEEETGRAVPLEKGTILVAEDHQVNQLLFKTILEHEGYTVRVASDGKEAVEAVRQDSFQVIFMDVQMPEMNGYEATSAIRNLGNETPIIAVTASAIKGEADKCYEVGMNDFLTKPFKKKDIMPVLERWTRAAPPSEVEDIPELEEIPEDLKIFDYEEAVSTFMGNEAVVKKVLKSYLEKVEVQIPTIEEALNHNDMETVRMEAHSIKGSGLNLQAEDIGRKAEKLEHAARDKDTESCREYLEEVRTAFARLENTTVSYISD